MRFYFAYGSNMSRARIEARLGSVRRLGRAELGDHDHAFDKLGRDGTGKGNVRRRPGHRVFGVVYELSLAQADALHHFEGGYEKIAIEVHLADGTRAGAFTYQAIEPMSGLRPTAEYFSHYTVGMRENELPDAYVRAIVRQAGLTGTEGTP